MSNSEHPQSVNITTKNNRLHSPSHPARSRAETSQQSRRHSSSKKGRSYFASNRISLKSRISYLDENHDIKEDDAQNLESSLTSVQIKLNKLQKKSIEYPSISKSAYDQNHRISLPDRSENPAIGIHPAVAH